MKSFIAILGLLLSLAGCYGPVEDHGEFISGIVSPDGTTLIFSYHTFVYRNARGLNAQPDGGKPWYLEDQISIGLYTFDTDEIQWLQTQTSEKKNGHRVEWYVKSFDGQMVLFAEGDINILLNTETGSQMTQEKTADITLVGKRVSFTQSSPDEVTISWYENTIEKTEHITITLQR